jgi:hypothetical protein
MSNRCNFTLIASLFFISLAVAIGVGCQTPRPEANAAPANAATPGKFTEADIAKLKWLEGTWRGVGEKQPPFYERYRFEGSTMIVEGLADETLQKVSEASRFELKDGEFGHSEGNSRSAASTITATAVQFVPVTGSKNSFRFEKQDDSNWQAVIEWPATPDKPARTIIYKMERWPKK